MFLKNSRSSEGVGVGVCACRTTVVAIVNRITPKRHCDRLFLRMFSFTFIEEAVQRQKALLPHHEHDEGAGLDAALWSPTRCARRRLYILGGTQKDLLRLWIESHGPRAWLRLHRAGVFVVVGRFFVK